MAVSYKPLWKLLIDRDMKKKDLKEKANLTSNVIARMGKNEYVSLESLVKICLTFECTLNDVIEIVLEDSK